jgi:hypothetical protein
VWEQAWFLVWAAEPQELLDLLVEVEHPDLVAIARIAALVRTIVAFELIIV